jgi:FixJ family two-component response regulator
MWIRAGVDRHLSEKERDVLWAKVAGLSTRKAAERLNITARPPKPGSRERAPGRGSWPTDPKRS